MKRTMSGAAMLAAVMALAPLQVSAQQGSRGQRGQAMGPQGAGVEMILRQREALELDADQVKKLNQIRAEAVQRRSGHEAEMAEARSQVLAGELKWEDLREQMQGRRAAAEAIQQGQREQVEAVLNDAQKHQIQEFQSQARAFQRGRMSAMRGGRQGEQQGQRGSQQRGMRGQRPGGMQGMRGMQGMMNSRRGPGGGPGFGPPGDTIPPA